MDTRPVVALKTLVVQAEEELERWGYGERTRKRYHSTWSQLAEYMAQHGWAHYETPMGMNFLDEQYGITVFTALTNENKVRARAIMVLNDYYLHGMIRPRSVTSAVASLTHYTGLLTAFQSHFQGQRSLVTIETYSKHLGKFLLYLEKHDIMDLGRITEATILGYTDFLSGNTPKTLYNALGALRVFLRYLHAQGMVATDWSSAVPKIRRPADAHLPSTFTPDEIQRILNVVDRANPTGKRDYAMLLLAARLGLRSGDIRHLTFAQLCWDTNSIDLVMQKTGRRLVLPLSEEVGMAIIEYVKYGRPTADSDRVFLRHVAPIQPLSGSTLSHIVQHCTARAGVAAKPGQHVGPHAMRHSLASVLLEENVPLPVIAEILGHADTRTTGAYVKISVNQLRQCALPMPPFDWNVGKEVF